MSWKQKTKLVANVLAILFLPVGLFCRAVLHILRRSVGLFRRAVLHILRRSVGRFRRAVLYILRRFIELKIKDVRPKAKQIVAVIVVG